MKYIVIKSHRSEYPDPIHLKKGTTLTVGEEYDGPEGWENWCFCSTPEHAGGWVPKQIIKQLGDGNGLALDDYTAVELNVYEGEALLGARVVNGWVWCRQPANDREGWVPLENLQPVAE